MVPGAVWEASRPPSLAPPLPRWLEPRLEGEEREERAERSGRGGSALGSHVAVCAALRGGGHTDVSIGLSARLLSGGGGESSNFWGCVFFLFVLCVVFFWFTLNAVKCGGWSSEGADKSPGRLRLGARTDPCVPGRRPVRMPGLV